MSLINMKLYKDEENYYDLKDVEYNIINNCIQFNVENITNLFKLKDYGCTFTRENDEFKFILDTDKNEASYLLKGTDTLLDIKIERCNYKKNDNLIVIEYQLETDDCLNRIELEIMEI